MDSGYVIGALCSGGERFFIGPALSRLYGQLRTGCKGDHHLGADLRGRMAAHVPTSSSAGFLGVGDSTPGYLCVFGIHLDANKVKALIGARHTRRA